RWRESSAPGSSRSCGDQETRPMRTVQLGVLSVACLAILALPSGCKKKSTAPASDPVITNTPGDFTYDLSGIGARTSSESYAWQSNAASATVTQTCSITAGYATLTIEDASHSQVYQHTLTDAGTYSTTVTSAGTW